MQGVLATLIQKDDFVLANTEKVEPNPSRDATFQKEPKNVPKNNRYLTL